MSNTELKFNIATYSIIVSISYFCIYAIAIFAASIYGFVIVKKDINSNRAVIVVEKDSHFRCWDLIQLWWQSFSMKKRIYIGLIPHLFDQATDCGLIMEWYLLWKYDDIAGVDMQSLVILSIAIMILHRIISAFAVFRLTRNPIHIILQVFELMMIKAIYVSYRVNSKKTCNPHRYLQVLEATFESGPQLLLSTGFAVKTKNISLFLLLSIISSLWNITSKISSDDKQILPKEIKTIDFQCSRPCSTNYHYFLHIFGWRFLEITCRVFICVLIWINLGGFALAFIFLIEFMYLAIFALCYKSVDILGLMMYITIANNYDSGAYNWFVTYRCLFNIIYLLLITIFAAESFSCSSCGNPKDRNDQTIKDPVGLFMLIYSWIGSMIWPYVAIHINDKITGVTITKLVRNSNQLDCLQWIDIVELFEFGVPIPPEDIYSKDVKKITILHRICETGPLCEKYFGLLIQIRPNWLLINNKYDVSCIQYLCSNSDISMWEDCINLLEILNVNQSSIDFTNVNWDNCMYNAVKYGSFDIVRILHQSFKVDLGTSLLEILEQRKIDQDRKEIAEYLNSMQLMNTINYQIPINSVLVKMRIRTLQGSYGFRIKQYRVDANIETDTVIDFKQKIKQKTTVPIEEQKLIFDKQQLDNKRFLRDYGIEKGSNIRLIQEYIVDDGW